MRRPLRLSLYAAAMLAVAVLACVLLQDESNERAGRHEVSGRIEGLTAHQQDMRRAAPAVAEKTGAGDASESGSALTPEKQRDLNSAKVQVLALAKAAAEKRAVPARAEDAPAPQPVPVPAPAPETIDAPQKAGETKPVPAPKAENVAKAEADKVNIQADSNAEAEAAAPRKAADPVKSETAEKAAAPKKAAEPKKVSFKKFEGSSIKVDPAAAKKAAREAALKAEARKAPAKKAVPSASPVEAALAEVRAGRLAPDEAVLTEGGEDATYDRVVTSAKFAMKGSMIKLVLRGNAPMVGHYYVLTGPDRVVLDLAGNWEIEMPRVPSNRLIASVRVGQHDDKTRLVFDMKNTGKVALVPLNRNALELRIR